MGLFVQPSPCPAPTTLSLCACRLADCHRSVAACCREENNTGGLSSNGQLRLLVNKGKGHNADHSPAITGTSGRHQNLYPLLRSFHPVRSDSACFFSSCGVKQRTYARRWRWSGRETAKPWWCQHCPTNLHAQESTAPIPWTRGYMVCSMDRPVQCSSIPPWTPRTAMRWSGRPGTPARGRT